MRKLGEGTGMQLEGLSEVELDRITPWAEYRLSQRNDLLVLDESGRMR